MEANTSSSAAQKKQPQKGKRSRGKRAGKKHKKGAATATTVVNTHGDNRQKQHVRDTSNNINNKWNNKASPSVQKSRGAKFGSSKPQKSDLKKMHQETIKHDHPQPPAPTKNLHDNNKPHPGESRRRKRGGSKRNAQDHSVRDKSVSATNTTTTWSALEKEWFSTTPSVAESGMAQEELKQQDIPDPMAVSDITTKRQKHSVSDNTSMDHLQRLWQNFSKKRQRQSKHSSSDDTTSTTDVWQPRPIQLQAWSILLPPLISKESRPVYDDKAAAQWSPKINMIGLSPTASGKTLAFGAPMVVAAAAVTNKNTSPVTLTSNSIFGIVLVPTRELAQQVGRELESMISCLPQQQQQQRQQQNGIRVLTLVGGDSSAQDQLKILQGGSGCRWLVSATPGRCWDVIQKLRSADKDADDDKLTVKPEYIVLDESDRLASNSDLGQQVTSILEVCLSPKATSLAFFSATYPHKVQEQWKEWMALSVKSCAMIRVDAVSMDAPNKRRKTDANATMSNKDDITGENAVSEEATKASPVPAPDDTIYKEESVDDEEAASERSKKTKDFLSSIPACLVQTLHVCAEHKKPKKLVHTLDKIRKEEKKHNARQKRLGIIFFGRIKTLQYISKLMEQQSKHACLELHSQLQQHDRTKNLQAFQAGKVPILLATDIAARGVHISNISFVINYDFPSSLEQYVHRCGRAGRNYQADADDELPPTIYSFFTRSMAPMAPDTVALLKASEAWVDPNLVALIHETNEGTNPNKKQGKRAKINPDEDGNIPLDLAGNPIVFHAEDSDDDAFPELSAKKIVLKRASHVSDASSDSDDSSDEE